MVSAKWKYNQISWRIISIEVELLMCASAEMPRIFPMLQQETFYKWVFQSDGYWNGLFTALIYALLLGFDFSFFSLEICTEKWFLRQASGSWSAPFNEGFFHLL